MLPAATIRALTIPAFTAAEFTPTQWASAEDKAKFANALMKFIANEFPRQSFTKPLYQRLSNTFGHIAHHEPGRLLWRLLRTRLGQGRLPRADLELAAFRRPDLHVLRRRARGQTPTARREGDRHLPFARGRRHPQARARDARSPAGEIRSADAAARSAPLARSRLRPPRQDDLLRRDPGRTGRQSPLLSVMSQGDRRFSPSNPERAMLYDKTL